MDLLDALTTWKEISEKHATSSYYDEDGNYIILFRVGYETKGQIKAVPGGIHWDLPEELLLKEHQSREDEYNQSMADDLMNDPHAFGY